MHWRSTIKKRFSLLTIVAVLGWAGSYATHAESILLEGGIVHTVSGAVHTNGAVLVNGSRIERVTDGKSRERILAGKTVDLKGLHLYPGLIALNTAMGLVEIGGVRATRDVSESGDYTPDVHSWIAVNPDSELIPVNRANGIAYFQPAPQGGIVSGQSALMSTAGWTMEDMIFRKPLALHVYWPDMGLNTTPKEKVKDQAKWKSLEDQAKERAKKITELQSLFDEARAYAKHANANKVPAWEAMLPYVSGELPIMVHADDFRQIKAAVEWGSTNKLKIIIAGGRDAWMVTQPLVTNRIPVVYEHTFTQPVRSSDPYDIHFKVPELLRKAGVQFAIGMGATTFDAALIKNLPYQAAHSIGFGLPREEALKSITLYPAQIAGVADRLGSIEPGKEATLVAATGDILDIRTQVKHVWVSGKEVSLENRHTRLYEKYQNRPKVNSR